MTNKILKPCPICGKSVYLVEINTELINIDSDSLLNHGRIECRCGLTFEKMWYSAISENVNFVNTYDIYEAWNNRVK